MSYAGVRGREWRFYLDDMIDVARNVQPCTHGLDQAGFVEARHAHDASFLVCWQPWNSSGRKTNTKHGTKLSSPGNT